MKTKLIKCFVPFATIFAILGIIYIKSDDKYMKAIKYAMKNAGEYFDVECYKDKSNKTITYSLKCHSLDYSKVAIQLEEYIFLLNKLDTTEYNRIVINIVNSKNDKIRLGISNFDSEGNIHDKFDIAVIGSKGSGYKFYGEEDKSHYSHFKRLEIGKGYSVSEILYFICYFQNVSITTCYAENDEMLSKIIEFTEKNLPDCSLINMTSDTYQG